MTSQEGQFTATHQGATIERDHPPMSVTDQRGEQRVPRHWLLAIVIALFVGLSLTYSLALPLGEAADETDHFALVRFIVEHGRPPLTVQERRAIGPKGDASPIYHGLVALLTQHVDVSALPALPDTQARPERFISTDGFRANRIFHTEDDLFPFRGIVLAWHLARLVSIPLGAVTVAAAYFTVLHIYPRRRYLALGTAGFVAFLPRFIINSAVVNDDSLVVPLVALAVYMMVRVAQGDHRRRTFLILGALMGLAAITKYHALVLLPEMTLLLIALAWRSQGQAGSRRTVWLLWLRRWGWVMISFVVVSGWWFGFLVVQFNQMAELGLIRGLMAPLGDPVVTTGFGRVLDMQPGGAPEYAFTWFDWASLFFRSFWVSYAWLHIFAPPAVYLVLGFVTLLAALGLLRPTWDWTAVAFRRWAARQRINDPAWQVSIALLALHALVYLGIIVTRYWLRPARETGQGRHLYPAITAVAFLFVLGLSNLQRMLGQMLAALPWKPARPSWLRAVVPCSFNAKAPRREDTKTPYSLLPTPYSLFNGILLVLSVVTLPFIIMPEYLPYLPIRTARPDQVPISRRQPISFAKGLDFVGYDLPSAASEDTLRAGAAAGEGLPITLYWYVKARQQRDYLVQLCLRDERGQTVVCHYGHPVDGRYPMRAWETGYLIRDQVILPTPYCLPADEYQLTLTLLPLRLDTAVTEVDHTTRQREPLSLGKIVLASAASQARETPNFDLWAGKERRSRGEIELKQIRQSLTVITYQDKGEPTAGSPPAVEFSRRGDPSVLWSPAVFDTHYRCPTGPAATSYSFVLDASVQPGQYILVLQGRAQEGLVADVATRWRDFSPPAEVPNRIQAAFAGQAGDDPLAETGDYRTPYLELLGYGADLSPRWPGDTINITAYWQSRRTMSRHYVVTLYLLDHMMRAGGQLDWTLGGHYPNVLWAPGEYVDETYPLVVKHQTPAGLYTIQLSLYDYFIPEGGQAGTFDYLLATTTASQQPVEYVYLGQVRVMDPAEKESPSHPMTVDLGEQIHLLGYDLVSPDQLKPGQTLNLALHWQAIRPPTADYTVFTQLIGPDGLVWGQQDSQPQGGRYPTTAWTVDQKVVDRYELTLRQDAPRGQYRLMVGMYQLATGQRLAAVGADGNRLADDAISLATISVE